VTAPAATAPPPAAPPERRAGGALSDALVIAQRNVLRIVRTPQLLVFSLLQPIIFMLLFRYVMGGAIPVPGMSYVDYLVPALLAQTVIFGGFATAIGVADDAQTGLVERFRALPMARGAFLGGRLAADIIRLAVLLGILVGIGMLVGFRFHNGIDGAVLAYAVCLAYGAAFVWLFALAGITVRDAESVQAVLLPVFPLTFVSTAFVPVDTMAGWLQPVARNQPFTMMVNAVRGLTQGAPAEELLEHSTSYYVVASLLWCAAIAAVCAPLAIRRYERG
jgi:ABC-2 type transport system permease protein